jgi:uncharacterized membrane protein HdeD (DUF308 family)
MENDLNRVRWSIGINGALSVAFGVLILVWPSISLFALTILFGAYTLATGVVGLINTFRVQNGRGWMAVSSLLSVAVGLGVLLWPSISAVALLYVIGAYAIAFGAILFGGALVLPIGGGDAVLLTLTGVLSGLFGIVMFVKPGDGAIVLLALIASFSIIVGVTQLAVAVGGRRIVDRGIANATRVPA